MIGRSLIHKMDNIPDPNISDSPTQKDTKNEDVGNNVEDVTDGEDCDDDDKEEKKQINGDAIIDFTDFDKVEQFESGGNNDIEIKKKIDKYEEKIEEEYDIYAKKKYYELYYIYYTISCSSSTSIDHDSTIKMEQKIIDGIKLYSGDNILNYHRGINPHTRCDIIKYFYGDVYENIDLKELKQLSYEISKIENKLMCEYSTCKKELIDEKDEFNIKIINAKIQLLETAINLAHQDFHDMIQTIRDYGLLECQIQNKLKTDGIFTFGKGDIPEPLFKLLLNDSKYITELPGVYVDIVHDEDINIPGTVISAN